MMERPTDQQALKPAIEVQLHPLDEAADCIRNFMEMPEEAITTAALFAAHTSRAKEIGYTTYLHITAATEQAGKTRLGDLLTELVFNPENMTLATEASLRRTALRLQEVGATLMIDEADKSLHDERVMALLNHGFTPGHTVPLMLEVEAGNDGKSSWQQVQVDPFGPKVIIGIGLLDDAALASRCIPIRLNRRAPGAKRLPRLTLKAREAQVRPVGTRLRRWAGELEIGSLDDFVHPDDYFPGELSDRECDQWLPLFVMADAAGGQWPRLAREAAVKLHHGKTRQRSTVEILLDNIARVLENERVDQLRTEKLNELLTGSEDYEWANYRSSTGVPFNVIEQARLLRSVGIVARRVKRDSDKNPQRYLDQDQFDEPWQRYGIEPPRAPREI